MAERYKKMAEGQEEDFVSFIDEFHKGIKLRLPLPKLNRWLGYIQGVLIERQVTSVQAERDYTRPFFRPLDFT